MRKPETKDMVLVLIFPIIATILSLMLKLSAFTSIIIFILVPSVYLSFRAKQYIKKSLIFAFIAGVPFIIIIDYIAHITKTWIIPKSILPFRLFGIVSIEIVLWSFSLLYFTVIFYEYFLDHHVTKRLWHPHLKYLIVIELVMFSAFLILFFKVPNLLNIPYFYLILGIMLMLIPVLIELFEHPKLSSKFFKTAAYFFFFNFLYEVTALKLGWWDFNGTQFIGWVFIFGVKFPFEELFFWFMLLAMAILSFYEFFDNHG